MVAQTFSGTVASNRFQDRTMGYTVCLFLFLILKEYWSEMNLKSLREYRSISRTIFHLPLCCSSFGFSFWSLQWSMQSHCNSTICFHRWSLNQLFDWHLRSNGISIATRSSCLLQVNSTDPTWRSICSLASRRAALRWSWSIKMDDSFRTCRANNIGNLRKYLYRSRSIKPKWNYSLRTMRRPVRSTPSMLDGRRSDLQK